MSDLQPLMVTKEQKDEIDRIESLPRRERRKLGKQLGVKIPSSNKPLHYGRTVLK